jgi:hypothetical protein
MPIFLKDCSYSIKQGLGIHKGIHWGEGVDWIDLAQDREKSWAILTTVMSPWVKCRHSLLAEELLPYQERLCCM